VLDDIRNSQLSALKAQMNPHFIFNVLNSIQEIVLLNDKKQANNYLGKFSDLMRLILDQSNKVAITLDDELRSLKLYLELEALRFEEYFKYEIIVADMLYTYNIYIPAMLIQPYVENAIKHGLMHKHGEKNLLLSFSLFNEHTLLCVITDNGIGRKRSSEINRMREKKHTSFATGATQRRLELLNQGKAQTITVSFVDLFDANGNGSGTKVLLYIPLVS
jgi:LytS/YehU family sensor histidine kinase